jgi:hypothetical protein
LPKVGPSCKRRVGCFVTGEALHLVPALGVTWLLCIWPAGGCLPPVTLFLLLSPVVSAYIVMYALCILLVSHIWGRLPVLSPSLQLPLLVSRGEGCRVQHSELSG